jgi:hypothetical protein
MRGKLSCLGLVSCSLLCLGIPLSTRANAQSGPSSSILSPIYGPRLSACTGELTLDLTEYRAARNMTPGRVATQREVNALVGLIVQEAALPGVITPTITLTSPGRASSISALTPTATVGVPDPASLDLQGTFDILNVAAILVYQTFRPAPAAPFAKSIDKAKATITAARASAALSTASPTMQYTLEEAKSAFDAAVVRSVGTVAPGSIYEKSLAELLCATLANGGKAAIDALLTPAPVDAEDLRRRIGGAVIQMPSPATVPSTWAVVSDGPMALSAVLPYLGIASEALGGGRQTKWTTPEGAVVTGLSLAYTFAEDIRPCPAAFSYFSKRPYQQLDQVVGVSLVVVAIDLPFAAVSCSKGIIRIATGPNREVVLLAVASSAGPVADPAITATTSTLSPVQTISSVTVVKPTAATNTKTPAKNAKAKTAKKAKK